MWIFSQSLKSCPTLPPLAQVPGQAQQAQLCDTHFIPRAHLLLQATSLHEERGDHEDEEAVPRGAGETGLCSLTGGWTWEQERVYSSCMHARAMEEFGDRRSLKERTSGRCWFIQSFPSLHLPQPLTTYLTLTLPLHYPTHFVGC